MSVGELLLEFTGEALLDLVEAGKQRDGDEDYNGTFAMADFELWRTVSVCIKMEERLLKSYLTSRDELEWSQRRLEIWDVGLEVVESS